MATYYPGSNDTAQTLHLLNPNYGAYADTPAGNMILMNPDEPQHNHQHHFIGIPFPQLSQHQTMTSPSSAQQHRQALMSAAAAAATANPYSMWRSNGAAAAGGGGGELMFMRENSSSGSGSSLPVNQLNNESSSNAISSSHQQHQHQHQQAVGGVGMGMSVGMGVGVGDISSQLGLRKHQPPPSISSYQDPSSLQHSLSLQTDNPHTHTQPPTANPTHGLSLSLSPQQPSYHSQDSDMSCPAISATSEDNNRKWNNHNLNNNHNNFREPAPSSRDVGSEYQQAPFVGYKVQVDTGGGITGVPLSSKYLRAAQLLLDEVVSVGKGLKLETGKANKNSSSWIGGGENSGNNEGKDEGSAADLSPAERQELQMKKSKLVAMLDEVDQRYRQYYHQMQIVVQSFEAAAGYGAAKTYTALALQTISRHFRCLRDAITGQIKMASKSLGDEDSSGSGKGETTRLRFVDQQLRQQRALQQLGMIQQHAWRPQRGLPERSVSVLRTWLFEHFLHPYPKDADKHMLAKKTGLTRSQVSNWFINARVRLWKPMVEEMYLEELKENEGDHGNDKSGKESNEKKDDSLSKEATSGYEQQINATNNVNNANDSLSPEGPSNNTNSKSETTSNMINMRNQAFGMGESQIFGELESEGMRQGQLKKPRNGIHESLLPPNMNMEVDLKTEEDSDRAEFEETHKFSDDRQEDFGLLHNAMVHPDTSGNFGSYQLADLSRFGQGSFTPRFNGNNGVSLTLGLQHADGLSLQGTQHSFLSPQSLALGRRHDLGGNSSSDYCNIESSTAHPTSIYESLGLQHPKRYATQLMH